MQREANPGNQPGGSTVLDDYASNSSDVRGYRYDPRGGTPVQHQGSNPGNYVRTVSQGRSGVSTTAGRVDLNAHAGSVMFEGVRPEGGWQPTPRPVLDSPVPQSAPIAEGKIVPAIDRARQGTAQGSEARSREESIDVRRLGAVLSRGLDDEGDRESASHGELIHTRRGRRAPEESERQKDKPVHGSTR